VRLLGSFSFRLALLYVGLFTLSFSFLLGLYYWLSIKRPMDALKVELTADANTLQTLPNDRLRAALEARAAQATPRQAYHALVAADGGTVSANLPSWPPPGQARWLRIEADVYRDGEEDDHEALVLDRRLPDGRRLLIGRDIDDLDGIEEGIRDAVIWLLPALLILGIAGGALMSRTIGRRIESVGAAARRVMDGDLSQRVPIRGTGDDLDRLGETLNLMLARIEASMESVRRVSDSVAHELRTPLARLQADLGEIETASPRKRAPLIARAGAEAELLGRMFDAVLRISRIEGGRHQAKLAPVDLGALIADAAELYGPAAEEKGLDFTLESGPGLIVDGDRDLLFQAVSNLIDNSIKFTPEGGRVRLRAQRGAKRIVLTLADSGPGIDEADRDKVSERFYRAPGAANVPGFGLGLALVTAVARLHRSELRLGDARPGLRAEWAFPAP